MKKIGLYLFGLLILLSCSGTETVEINLDSDNFAAPILPAGTYEAAAKYNQNIMSPFAGYTFKEVRYYIDNLPEQASVIIYEDAGSNPGAVLYSSNVTSEVNDRSWNEHTLSTPLTLDGSAIWVAIRFVHAQDQTSIGCDPGPAVSNGDWLFDNADNQWRSFEDRTITESINWNIRAVVESVEE
jgi:hypothetical protein